MISYWWNEDNSAIASNVDKKMSENTNHINVLINNQEFVLVYYLSLSFNNDYNMYIW